MSLCNCGNFDKFSHEKNSNFHYFDYKMNIKLFCISIYNNLSSKCQVQIPLKIAIILKKLQEIGTHLLHVVITG